MDRKNIEKLIISNSKDAKLGEKLLRDLKKANNFETLISIKQEDLSMEYEGETFRLYATNEGQVIAKPKGDGITTIISENNAKLATYLISSIKEDNFATEEIKEMHLKLLSDLAFVMVSPQYFVTDEMMCTIFTDRALNTLSLFTKIYSKIDLTIDDIVRSHTDEMAKILLDYANNLKEEGLQEETIELDQSFKEATLGLEQLKEAIQNE